MSRKNLFILALILFTVGVALVIGNSGVLNQPKKTDQTSISDAVQKAAQEATGGQSFRDAADSILGGTTTPVPSTTTNTVGGGTVTVDSIPAGQPEDIDQVILPKDAIDEARLSQYKVDALLDGSNVYNISRDKIKDEKINIELDKLRCFVSCLLIKTPEDWMTADFAYYLSSFKKNDDILWIAFYKTGDGYTYAEISKPRFKDRASYYLTDDRVLNIFQKDALNGIYLFETDRPSLITIDFKIDPSTGDD